MFIVSHCSSRLYISGLMYKYYNMNWHHSKTELNILGAGVEDLSDDDVAGV